MVPLYLARIEDLGPGDLVKIDCAACSHTALLSTAFLSRLGLDPRDKVLDHEPGEVPRLRCARSGGGIYKVGETCRDLPQHCRK
jgi:hypothetical protein